MIYFKGDARSGDIFYVRGNLRPDGLTAPIRVNIQAGSAVAIGTVRGPQIALGRDGRVHVVWMGSEKAEPRGPSGSTPVLYARLNGDGSAFEAQRNIMQFARGLDGGLSVTANKLGDVYVVWHGHGDQEGEDHRRVWIARSSDGGRTFVRERAATSEPTGACGCCGMAASADDLGAMYILYRAATESVHRDMVLLVSRDRGKNFRAVRVSKWQLNMCPMSTASFAQSMGVVLAAWERAGQVYFSQVGPSLPEDFLPLSAPDNAENRKHPVVARNAEGETILVWTEGTGWAKVGSVVWQVFDRTGRPAQVRGRAEGLPVWGLASVFAEQDGAFTIVY